MKKHAFGIIGIVVALVGIGVAILQDELRGPPPSAQTQLKERVVEKGIELLGGEVEKPMFRDRIVMSYTVLGFIAIVLGVVSYVRKENPRISALSGALGAIAIAWEYVLIGIGIGVVVLILGAFS